MQNSSIVRRPKQNGFNRLKKSPQVLKSSNFSIMVDQGLTSHLKKIKDVKYKKALKAQDIPNLLI